MTPRVLAAAVFAVALCATFLGVAGSLPAGPTVLDTAVWEAVPAWRSAPATAVAAALRVAGGIYPLTMLAGAAFGLLAVRRRWPEAALVAVAPFLSTALIDALKAGYARPRPPLAGQLIPEAGWSLPSGHAVDAAIVLGTLALILAWLCGGALRAAVLAAAGVGIAAAGMARVYLGVHWVTDVIAGWLLGGAWLALCTAALLLKPRPPEGPDDPDRSARRVGPPIPAPRRPPAHRLVPAPRPALELGAGRSRARLDPRRDDGARA